MFGLFKSTEKKRSKKVFKYVAVKQTLKSSELGCYDTYGVELKGEGVLVNDVSCNHKEAKKIVDKLNKYQADPIHILDIIQDMIAV